MSSDVDAMGEMPRGDSAIALMRLVCQAQTPYKQLAILNAWDGIAADDRAVLASEMCRTGFADQVIYKYRDTCIYV